MPEPAQDLQARDIRSVFALEDSRPSESPLVSMIWRVHSASAGSFLSRASPHWEIVVTKYEGETMLTLRGPETKASPADFPADAEWLGIAFRLGTFMPHLPASQLVDTGIHLPEAAARSVWLGGASWEIPSFDNADTFVNRLVRDGLLAHDPVVDAALQGQPQAFSPRALQYRFQRATGLTQKTIHQMERAQRAAALLVGGVPILEAAHEVGYFDQSHLTNALRRFLGQTPAEIARDLSTARPPE